MSSTPGPQTPTCSCLLLLAGGQGLQDLSHQPQPREARRHRRRDRYDPLAHFSARPARCGTPVPGSTLNLCCPCPTEQAHGVETQILAIDFSKDASIYDSIEKELSSLDIGILGASLFCTRIFALRIPLPPHSRPHRRGAPCFSPSLQSTTLASATTSLNSSWRLTKT